MGTGTANIVNELELEGIGTAFKKEIMVGDTIRLTGTKVSLTFTIRYLTS